jgi:uncharacterized protein (TIGR00369 family)
MDENAALDDVRRRNHPRCFVGRREDRFGLGVTFTSVDEARVEATVECPASWEGYPGVVHGGIVASLLDAAMTNSLFARGLAPLTVELRVRYRRPLVLGRPGVVAGRVTGTRHGVLLAEADIVQDARVCASATGRFMRAG